MQAATPTSQPPSWRYRPYKSGDECEAVLLFERVFGHAMTEDHWRWKLKALPSPVESVWLGVAGERLIFHYGGIPCRFKLPGGECIAMVSVDGMTAPEFRRQGVLTQTCRHVYDVLRHAEQAFWEMPAVLYALVVAAGDWLGGACPFRGIHPWPFTDPLAPLAGRRQRAALHRLVTEHVAGAIL